MIPGLSPIGDTERRGSGPDGGSVTVPGMSPIGGLSAGDGGSSGGGSPPEPIVVAPVPGLLGAARILLEIDATGMALRGGRLLGIARALLFNPPSMALRGGRLLGTPAARLRSSPPAAAEVPSGVTLYRCMLTGAQDGRTDAILRIRSFQVRHRRDTASYYQVVIPSLEFIDAIDDRPNGQIVIWSDTDGIEEELMRGSLGIPRGDKGPRNQAVTISGNASRAATPRATYTITDVEYQYSTFDGEQRLRIRPRAGIRPGDTIRYGGLFFTVGVVTWSVSVSETGMSAQMEVATLAEGE